MPTWTIVLIWVVIAAIAVIAVGAWRERRRGVTGAADPAETQARAEAEMRMHNRAQQGYLNG